MAETFYEALVEVPSHTLLSWVLSKDAREVFPGFYDLFVSDYRQVFEEWRRRNELVHEVVAGGTSFWAEWEGILSGRIPEYTDRYRSLAECVGPIYSATHPRSTLLMLSAAGVALGTGGGVAYGQHRQATDPEFLLNPALSTSLSRRRFLNLMASGGAAIFGAVGGGVGYLVGKISKESVGKKATTLDSVVRWLYPASGDVSEML